MVQAAKLMGALKPSAIFPHTQGLAALRLGAPAQGPHWGLGPCRHPLASLRALSDIFKDGTAMSMLVNSLAPWLPGEGCHGLDHSADHDDGGSRQQAAGDPPASIGHMQGIPCAVTAQSAIRTHRVASSARQGTGLGTESSAALRSVAIGAAVSPSAAATRLLPRARSQACPRFAHVHT